MIVYSPDAQNDVNGEARRYIMKFGRSSYAIHSTEQGGGQFVQRIWHGREHRPT